MAVTLTGQTYKDRNTVEGSTYDWTVLPASYGTIYDARSNGKQLTGAYVPVDGSTAGRPSGSALVTTQAPTSGNNLVITSAMMTTITTSATASASTDTVTATAHGLANGDPVYFTSLTGGAGVVTGPVSSDVTVHSGWYAAANCTANTFTLRECYPRDLTPGTTSEAGLFHDVDITTNYTAMTLVKGKRYDQTDFQCYIAPATSAAGLVLIHRSRFSGPATADTSGGFIFNAIAITTGMVFVEVDNECVPQDFSTYQDFTYGANTWSWRSAYKRIVDGHGSQGNVHLYGRACAKLFWAWPDVASGHSDGTHNDAGIQVLSGAVHDLIGCYIDGDVDHTVSTTTDAINHPIVSDTVSAGILVGNNVSAPDVYATRNDHHNGYLGYNIANVAFSNLGRIFANELHKSDADKQGAAPQLMNIPDQLAGNASTPTVTIHVYCPSSGVNANYDETGTVISNFNPAANATLTYP